MMQEAAQSPLAAWESFYVIVGSSGAALTGLQFVVIALISDIRKQTTPRQIAAFGTPTIVHFCDVLLIAAMFSAPWHGLRNVAIALGACGAAGIVYAVIIVSRTRRQTGYTPVFEDWLWHAVLPFTAYSLQLISAVSMRSYPRQSLFIVAGTTIMLLFIGIHNAWDTVTYITVGVETTKQSEPEQSASVESPDNINSAPAK